MKPTVLRKAIGWLAATSFALGAQAAFAAEFPSAPIRLVVPFAAGSGTDQQARAFAQALTEGYGVTVVVENKPGASGALAAQDVARAAPDGYTVLMTTNTTHAANQHLYKNLPYDPVKDFTPITALSKGAMLMVVNTASPVKSVGEFITLAKEKPDGLTFGSGSSSSRVGGEMFQQLTGTKMLHVPYKSNPQAHIDLIGGQIDVVFSDVSSTIAHVQSGKLRALGYTGAKRTPILPDLPTVAEAGVPGYEVSYWTAVYLPAGAPQPVVDKLHDMFVSANNAPAMERIRAVSSSEVFTTTPQGLAEFQAQEAQRWGEVIRAAGIEPE